MKRILNGSFAVILLSAILLLLSCNSKDKKLVSGSETTKYTCSMHPQIIRNEPGLCPICSMNLVPLNNHSGHEAVNDSLALLVKPTNASVISSIKTITPQSREQAHEISLNGIINYDTNNWKSISARVSGRIERLYIKYNYEAVSKGQKIMDIYSPDLVNAQQELLFLKNNAEPELVETAKRKLRLLGATDQQISNVLKTGKISYSVGIYSPYSGYVAEQRTAGQAEGIPNAAGGTMITSSSPGASSMGSTGKSESSSSAIPALPDISTSSPIQLREGQYISAGQKLFSLINASQVWAEFYAAPDQLNEFKKGTTVQVQSVDILNQRTSVPVSLIQPYYNQGVNYSLVRATIPNADKRWKVGQLITVTREGKSNYGTWLPRTAVLQLGTRYVSFVHRKGAFVPVYVQVENLSGDWVDIGNSLNSHEPVAVNAWFLVDSESFIKVERL
ncbi:MAG: efflux RND transporter periplasmic adaptor subunit [Daejeonella sp.]